MEGAEVFVGAVSREETQPFGFCFTNFNSAPDAEVTRVSVGNYSRAALLTCLQV